MERLRAGAPLAEAPPPMEKASGLAVPHAPLWRWFGQWRARLFQWCAPLMGGVGGWGAPAGGPYGQARCGGGPEAEDSSFFP
eukprot:2995685-Alexandrium_andersonii.AAC.1